MSGAQNGVGSYAWPLFLGEKIQHGGGDLLYKMGKTRATKNTTQTHTTNNMSGRRPLSGSYAPLSPWEGQSCPQIMTPPPPNAIRRPRAAGLAFDVFGLLTWGGEMRGIKK